MKTTTFQDILNQAAEFAQRTRDQIPPQEYVSLQGMLATEFETLFTAQAWPELIPPFWNNANIVNQMFSKNEGSVDPLNPELGEILAITTHDPHTCHHWECVDWSEGQDGNGNSVVYVDSCRTSLYVEYMIPYPGVTFPELATMNQATFLAALCPRRWRQTLAHKAAAHLLGSDGPGNASAMGAQLGLANSALVSQIQRLPAAPDWRGFRAQRPRERRYGISGAWV